MKIETWEWERLLITGDSGFVGQHALRLLPRSAGLHALEPGADLCDTGCLEGVIRRYRPDCVLHLAGISNVPFSFKEPKETYRVNFDGTFILLNALRKTDFCGRLLFVGSGDVYGHVEESLLPIHEDNVLRPLNPYAVSKVAAEALCYQWSQTGTFDVMMARPFNHVGAGQAATFAISDFARQVVDIVHGKQEPVLQTGDIDVTRDFTDVEDVVLAYGSILASGLNGEIYNVCSGNEYLVRELVERLIGMAGTSASIVRDPQRSRKSDQRRVRGSFTKLHAATGWLPHITMDESLRRILAYWERQVATSETMQL